MRSGNQLSQREILTRCQRAGARIESGGKHIKVYVPGGGIVVLPKSGSDSWRGWRNTLAQLKREGLDIR